MVSFNNPPQILDNLVSVRGAGEWSGYTMQYIRRLLRNGDLVGIKVEQVWLIDLVSLETYIGKGQIGDDKRFGPKTYSMSPYSKASEFTSILYLGIYFFHSFQVIGNSSVTANKLRKAAQ